MSVFPPLDSTTEAALRASISRFGVIVPVVVDQRGAILDGNNRSRIARELGISYETQVREVSSNAERDEIARTLNSDRRHMTIAQRRQIVVALRAEGHSYRAIGNALGVSEKTAWKDRNNSTVTQVTVEPDRVLGLDGRSRPAARPKEHPAKGRERGVRWVNRDQPYEAETERQRQKARAQLDRLVLGLSEINGICRGLRDVDLHMAAAVAQNGDIETWASRAGSLSSTLAGLRRDLREVAAHACAKTA